MKGGLSLVPKILKKHISGGTNKNCAGQSNNISKQGSNPVKSKKRKLAAKNKSNSYILELNNSLPKEREKQTRVFGTKYHVGFKNDNL